MVCVSNHFNDGSGREKYMEIKISYFAVMKGRHETFKLKYKLHVTPKLQGEMNLLELNPLTFS